MRGDSSFIFSIFQGPQGPPGGLGNPGPIGEKVRRLKMFKHISVEHPNEIKTQIIFNQSRELKVVLHRESLVSLDHLELEGSLERR